jgi:hypothetical protein
MNLPEIGYSSSEERVSPLPASLACRLPTSTSNTPRAHFRSPIEPRYARRMPPSDIDIQHSAYRWLQIHGDRPWRRRVQRWKSDGASGTARGPTFGCGSSSRSARSASRRPQRGTDRRAPPSGVNAAPISAFRSCGARLPMAGERPTAELAPIPPTKRRANERSSSPVFVAQAGAGPSRGRCRCRDASSRRKECRTQTR